MIQCITCKQWDCQACTDLSVEVYDFLSSTENTVCFCVACKESTLETLEAGAQIKKKRCQRIEEKYDAKLQDINIRINEKADKCVVDNIKAEQLLQVDQLKGLAHDVSELNKKIDMVSREPRKKITREKPHYPWDARVWANGWLGYGQAAAYGPWPPWHFFFWRMQVG